MRDGIATLTSNAFADAQHQALAYLVVPVGIWFVLGPALLLPVALVGGIARRGGPRLYVGSLVALATVVGLLPSIDDALGQMRATGVVPGAGMLTLLGAFVVVLAAAFAMAAQATVAWWAACSWRTLRAAAATSVVLGGAATFWTAAFLVANLSAPAVAALAPGGGAPAADSPNVLLVSIDTLRADELGAYGSRLGLTPNLDRLAADGVTFEQAISPSPWTLPALAALMTGRYPRRHGAGAVTNRHDPLGRSALAPDVPTLAEAFGAAGYRTHAIVTNPYLFARTGLGAGYQGYLNLTFFSEAMLAGRTNAGQWLLDHLAPYFTVGDRGEEVSDRAIAWLDDRDEQRPFFMWLHYIDTHGPYGGVGTSRHKSFRGELSFGGLAGHAEHERSPEPVRLRSGEVRLGESERQAMRALYRDEVAEVDRQVGRLLAALDANGLAERTVVVVVSDHGEEFWEHGGVEHGHSVYDEVLRAVWLMRWPGHLPAGHRVPGVASTVDVAPTIQDLARLAPLPAIDGCSLIPTLNGGADPERGVLSENLLFAEERVSLRTSRAKLVRWANGKEEAYDLVHDPAERRDLAGTETFVAPLRVALERFEQAMAPSPNAVAAAAIPAAALRALGYVH